MKKIILTSLVLLMTLGLTTAMNIQFFYSETCPYCRQIYPFVQQKAIQYTEYTFEFLDTSIQDNYNKYISYEFTGVPAFVINTDDNREIKFVGADKRRLNCELQEMSTKECPTYQADMCINESWFI